jgi:hypothetical protein
MSQIIEVDTGTNPLKHYERVILGNRACRAVLPATIIREGGVERIVYITDSHLPICDHAFRELREIFGVLNAYILSLMEAENALLALARIPTEAERLYLHETGGTVALIYGTVEQSPEKSLPHRVGSLAEELKGLHSIVGAGSAMEQLSRKIGTSNPGAEELLKMVESIEREWNCIHPPVASVIST